MKTRLKNSWFWVSILAISLSLLYMGTYKKIPVSYFDEPLWIKRGYFFELMLHKDFNNPLWFTDDGYDQPKLMELVYGAVLYPEYIEYKKLSQNKDNDYLMFMIDHNLYDAFLIQDTVPIKHYKEYQLRLRSFIRWNDAIEFNRETYLGRYGNEFEKTYNLILKARQINIVFLLLASIMLYIIGRRYFSPLQSFLISVFFGSNTLVVTSGLRAHSEGLFLLLFITGIYSILIHFNSHVMSLRSSVLCGAVIGLCTATKLNGTMLLIFFIIFAIFHTIKTGNIKYILSPVLVIVISTGVFVLLNPFTYENPIKNVMYLYAHRSEVATSQQISYPQEALTLLSTRTVSIIDSFFGSRAAYFNTIYPLQHILPTRVTGFLGLGMFTIGLIHFISTVSYSRFLFLMMFFGTFISMEYYLLMNWSRYYLPLSVFIILFEAIGLSVCIQGLKNRFLR